MKSYTFYVASKYENRGVVAGIIALLRARGHRILGDWTPHTVEGVAPEAVASTLQAFAEEDYRAASEADHFILLHHDNCRGGFSELGIALNAHRFWPSTRTAQRRRIIVVGGKGKAPVHGPIFYFMPEVVHVDTVEEMLSYIDALAKEG